MKALVVVDGEAMQVAAGVALPKDVTISIS